MHLGFVLSDMMDEWRGVYPDMTGIPICLTELTAVKRLLSSTIPVGS